MSAVTISFCLDSERDQDLITWLESQGGRTRSAIIRDTLRQGLARSSGHTTLAEIRLAVRAELANYALRSSGIEAETPEPEGAAGHLDALEDRLEQW